MSLTILNENAVLKLAIVQCMHLIGKRWKVFLMGSVIGVREFISALAQLQKGEKVT